MYGSSVVDGTGQIFLDDLQCTGSESRLVDCPHNGLGSHNCDHSQDAGVRCVPGIIVLINLVYYYTELHVCSDSHCMYTACGLVPGPYFQFLK